MTAAGGSLNWREIDLVLEELDLAGTVIQEARQPSHDRIVLDLFRPHAAEAGAGGRGVERLSLLVCLSNRFPRIHAVTGRMANPARAPRFAMFLRAHAKGGKISASSQVGHERVVRLEVVRNDGRILLWIRLWGSATNLIVTDENGLILDAFYRRPKRGEVSGGHFEVPQAREPSPLYEVRELAGEGSFNERLGRYFEQVESEAQRGQLAAQAEAELSMREAKLAATLQKLESRRAEYANLERWKELGDLITSNLHLAKKGERWLRVEDWHRDGAPVDIELVVSLSPVQNAERYYERYRKARDGRQRLERDVAELTAALAEVERQRARVTAGADIATIREARAAGTAPPGRGAVRKPGSRPEAPGLLFTSPPWRLLVGRSARENDELLRHHVRGNDWWFHARDWTGAYVFVKSDAGKPPPLEVMLDAANLAIHFSRGKSAGGGDVYYTQVKYLRRAKDGPRGLVLPTQEKNISVKLDPARIERLKAGG